jgi:uncharacterized protein YecE (DUF72 family)
MALYVGTAGWSYPGGEGRWDGVFYPGTLADKEKLAYYAQFFNAVEINSSFYRPPNAQAAKAWAAKVPAEFRFTAKIWQKFTHPKMFEEATGKPATLRDDDFDLFVGGVEPLASAGKLGALLAQFPASFKADPGNLDYLTDLVRRFAAGGFPLAVELRHRGWTDDQQLGPLVRALFEEEGVAWTMIDEPKFRTSIRDVPLTSRIGYFRFHGRNFAQWWHHDVAEDRYNYLYPAAEQAELTAEVAEVAERTENTFVFYNNHYRAKAVVNALQLRASLNDMPHASLPASLLDEYPQLAAFTPLGADARSGQGEPSTDAVPGGVAAGSPAPLAAGKEPTHE